VVKEALEGRSILQRRDAGIAEVDYGVGHFL
jgi:hypothetical protein